eukprot:8259398-Pyramimonas_sp.AAC.1
MATMSLQSVIRSGGHLVLVGDPKQLPPTVISRKAADLGLCLSIFDRLHHAMRDYESAVIQLSLRYRMHPLILAWPSWVFYNNTMRTGLVHPLTQRPLVKGLLWQEFRPWDDDKLEKLAEAARTGSDDMRRMLENLDPGKQLPGELHRFPLVDNPSLE